MRRPAWLAWIWILQITIPLATCDKYFHALLSGTLKTFQQAACEDQLVSLRCPAGTCISVLVAQYGQSASDQRALCRDERSEAARRRSHNTTCPWPTSIQNKWEAAPEGNWGKYSLLQTVMEACHKKRQCKFHASPSDLTGAAGPDPCPGFRKYVEVAYKCRPYEFRSKIACQEDSLQLSCNPHSRVAVYSASYGRTEYESVRCPQPQGVREETCLATYATETVMQICHGKRHCGLTADAATFGNPCRPDSRTYLKVVYTCVPKTVLREQLDDQVEEDERRVVDPDYPDPESADYEHAVDEHVVRENRVYSESPPPRLAVAAPAPSNSSTSASGDGLRSPPPPPSRDHDHFQEERDQVVLFLVFAVSCGLALLAALAALRFVWARNGARGPAKGFSSSEDGASEIDLTASAVTVLPGTGLHHAHGHTSPQEVIRYNKGETLPSMSLTSDPDYCYG